MEPLEAVMVLVLTVLLMFIVMSPATWSSSSSSSSSSAPAAAAAACDGDLYGYPSPCITSRLDFVFSPYTPYSLFDDECPSSNNGSSIAPDNTLPSNEGSGEPELASVADPAPPPSVPTESA